jgi:hypothetical protein
MVSEVIRNPTSEVSSKWLEMSSIHFHECVRIKMYKCQYM